MRRGEGLACIAHGLRSRLELLHGGGTVRQFDRTVLCEAPLPTSVEDHWRNYKDGPDYKLWVSGPRYRVIIEPTEGDLKLVRRP